MVSLFGSHHHATLRSMENCLRAFSSHRITTTYYTWLLVHWYICWRALSLVGRRRAYLPRCRGRWSRSLCWCWHRWFWFHVSLGCIERLAQPQNTKTQYSHRPELILTRCLTGVLKIALIHDGLARGLREASKALDRRQAHMCVLNEACEEEAYKKLVVALCSEHKIPLIKVPDGKMLGEWAGLCVLDREGNARKVVNCSCVVVRDWGEESQERSVLLNYFQTEQ